LLEHGQKLVADAQKHISVLENEFVKIGRGVVSDVSLPKTHAIRADQSQQQGKIVPVLN
jgi:hypothetical protein